MNRIMGDTAFEVFCNIAKEFSPCMNDYLFVYAMDKDTFFITENAISRFPISTNILHNIAASRFSFIHPDDHDLLQNDINKLLSGEMYDHNLLLRWLGKDGTSIWVNSQGHPVMDSNGKPELLVGCINEIGNKQKADNISGLLSEASLNEQLGKLTSCIDDAMFLRVGIDDFRTLNERHGKEYGNFVLRSVAERIKALLNSKQYVYRLVSDEYMILDLSGSDYSKMKKLYQSIRSSVDDLVAEEHYKAVYTISGGLISMKDMCISTFYDSAEALKLSEFALTEAKRRGKNQMYYFQPEDYTHFLRKRYIRSCLNESIRNEYQGFSSNFQPIIMSNKETLFAAEALLRFQTPSGENISPYEFIPILEDTGIIIPVGKWILKNALAMCKKCREVYPDFAISVNLSYVQLLKSSLYEDVLDALDESDLPSSALIVELTESGHLENSIAVQNVWHKLRSAGVSIALDDFGTGYSNLINISNLRPNIVKVDRSFTLKALNNSYEREIMLHIIKMVHSIGLNLIVEGIETHEELVKVTEMNPDFIQGYYYSRPCPEKVFYEKYLK